MTQSKERVMGEEGLYRSSFEHDNCGIGAVVNIKGEKSHATVENALKIVENGNTASAYSSSHKMS